MGESVMAARSPSTSKLEKNFHGNGNRVFFGEIARLLWPVKTDVHLSQRAGTSDRMARYWLEGTHQPSAPAVRAVLGEILDRLG